MQYAQITGIISHVSQYINSNKFPRVYKNELIDHWNSDYPSPTHELYLAMTRISTKFPLECLSLNPLDLNYFFEAIQHDFINNLIKYGILFNKQPNDRSWLVANSDIPQGIVLLVTKSPLMRDNDWPEKGICIIEIY